MEHGLGERRKDILQKTDVCGCSIVNWMPCCLQQDVDGMQEGIQGLYTEFYGGLENFLRQFFERAYRIDRL